MSTSARTLAEAVADGSRGLDARDLDALTSDIRQRLEGGWSEDRVVRWAEKIVDKWAPKRKST